MRLPPVAPLRKGGRLTLAVGRIFERRERRVRLPPVAPLRKGGGVALAGGF